ncbi:AAA-like domain-containing protein [Spirulina subsalsa]|uniref:AAA-like domain-containing protein n=1 Tax=Spirulina subsalsa TaxID=54311 RepID=UPI000314C70B|nr:AAA-like domain-containing protein [Spirulina subsalsa]
MKSQQSPSLYQVGGSLPHNAPTYAQRQADEEFYQALLSGDFCYVLNARQMGKSSLRVRTMQRLQAEGIACVAIDITVLGTASVTPEAWYAGMIDILIDSLDLDDQLDCNAWWAEHNYLSNVHRFSKFIVTLLELVPSPLVIFIDEIDSILSLDFNLDDFFAVIRDIYNKRADLPAYQRITFALIGVATPGDLIADKKRTPFNIGRAIELQGFELQEALPLSQGLVEIADDPEQVLAAILDWTGGQPFLTQKLCHWLRADVEQIPQGREKEEVAQLVQRRIVENWEMHDEPEHLRTIQNRLLSNEQLASRLLGVYQQILQAGQMKATGDLEITYLRLMGLVVKRGESLKVANPIYGEVFNLEWVEKALNQLRPYNEAFNAWLTSERQDKSRLLRGQALRDALTWREGKRLSTEDEDFLSASQQQMSEETRSALEAEQTAREVLSQAYQKAKERIRWGTGILMVSLLGSGVAVWGGHQLVRQAQTVTRLEQQSNLALEQFEFQPIPALVTALETASELASLTDNGRRMADYPTKRPVFALQSILGRIRAKNELRGHSGGVYAAQFSPDGQHIVTASIDRTARLWNQEGKELAVLTGHSGGVYAAQFSPDGQRIVTASDDGTARLWNQEGEELAVLTGYSGGVYAAQFSPDGQRIVTASDDGTARLWNQEGKELAVLTGHSEGVMSAQFSPDGQRIVTASEDNTARLWNQEGKELAVLTGHSEGVMSAQFSPDGQRIVTASWDGTARLWNQEGEELAVLTGYSGGVYAAQFSPDGQRIVTASDDGTARLWTLDGQSIGLFSGHLDAVLFVQFSPDGQQILTSSGDGTTRLWPVRDLPQLLAAGCDHLRDFLRLNPLIDQRLEVCHDSDN